MTSALPFCGLNGDRQQNLVDILTELATTDPRWAATTAYQVLPWARIHPGDLSDEELIWHGITSDIDLSTGNGLQPFSITAVNIGPAATSAGRLRSRSSIPIRKIVSGVGFLAARPSCRVGAPTTRGGPLVLGHTMSLLRKVRSREGRACGAVRV